MKRVYIVALLALTLALVSCGPAPAAVVATIPEITIRAADFAFNAPTSVPSGYVTITLVNDGKEPHHAQLVKLNEGVTMGQLQTALQQQDPTPALALVSLHGGPGVIEPGQSQKVTLNLPTGQYVMLCFVSGADNVPHLAKGMIATLDVTSAPGSAAGAPPAAAAEPRSDGTVTLKDFAIQMPTNLKSGAQVWKVTNAGPEPHELGLFKLTEGKTAKDFEAFMQKPDGPPPFTEVGGLQAISANTSGWVHMNMTPGTYVALCFVPSPAQGGKAHVELGMMTTFTVQ